MSKQTQFIVLDVDHPQHPMHPVDPDNYIVLRQRYGDGQPTKSKPEEFVSVDLISDNMVYHIKNSVPNMQYGTDLILCTDSNGGTYAFLGEWRNGMCSNPNTQCHDLRKDAPPRKEKLHTELTYCIAAALPAQLSPQDYDVVTLVQSNFKGSEDLILCYRINPIGNKENITFYLGHWNDGC